MSKSLVVFRCSSLSVALAAALAACQGGHDPGEAAAGATAVQSDQPAERLATLDHDRLRALASQALRDRRVHTPGGDNAVEYYLALRDKAPGDAAIATALVEFQPYVLIAAEQALARRQPEESDRLLALLSRIDDRAPALPRLRASLAGLRASLADEQTAARDAALAMHAEDQRRAQASETASVARFINAPTAAAEFDAPAAAAAPAVVREVAAALRAEPVPAGVPSTPTVASEPERPTRVSQTAAAERSLPRLLEDEAPRYPLAAMNRKLEGHVEIAFTIQPDGRVANARVVSAEPAGVFDRAALAAASRWRFESTGSAASTSRTLTFRLPKG
ncbi:energy transducer TonB [Cognatilysobacter bugurensis]|uniref:Protein TonB n=1 Tax=Cognatilysobacter bugurensis TaxID=543356 RepID=A0A918SVH4_9GAMM|nr:energy transducer TonB [Lysobacter bugurensis]GHA73897.1 cell envelope biogenesis protein TonB [Lysobacter bugurensis]